MLTVLEPTPFLFQVEKMDDITSCLTVLSEYMGSWSQGMAEYNTNMVAELKLLKVRGWTLKGLCFLNRG